MKWLFGLGATALAIAGFVWWFTSLPGPKQLDMANNAFPGDSNAKLLIKDQTYDKKLNLGMNIWASEEASDQPRPVVVFIYGGGWRQGSKDEYAFAGRALANRGYIVALPDYRLYPDAKFPAFLEDSAKALAWVHDNIARVGGDPERIFISGQSAGAYNVLMLALDRQWLGREGKSTDIIKGVAALAGPTDFYPFKGETRKNSFGSYHKPEMTQPINFVRADAPPLWLATGIDDTQVDPRNSRVLHYLILEAGGDAQYTEYPEMDHLEIMMAIAKPFRGKGPVLDDMVEFFESQN
ncbi:alpha/beta hydrolase [Parasphingorhabdus halotolerans]|uniref:Alpha/beta hydrolase n=1 Tax=Parasphingorhabdus halotolerans TaxID=2725558 RepID=A0A6H2DN14_9SPHN|nr:alpha/beta hydrolase [Parasphingorhabdus halotolerans]QJB69578.1 alpha/beta hydrolase [Parasphingorhabdus halotolerans]